MAGAWLLWGEERAWLLLLERRESRTDGSTLREMVSINARVRVRQMERWHGAALAFYAETRRAKPNNKAKRLAIS